MKVAAKAKNADQGLKTWGAFGPVLGLVLVDAAENKLAWGHWEQGANGPLAVFRYSVPKDSSHYEVRYCCVAAAYGMESNSFNVMSGYHGEIAVDPASGRHRQGDAAGGTDLGRSHFARRPGGGIRARGTGRDRVHLPAAQRLHLDGANHPPDAGPQRAFVAGDGPGADAVESRRFRPVPPVPRRDAACFRAPRNGPPGWRPTRRFPRSPRRPTCSLPKRNWLTCRLRRARR